MCILCNPEKWSKARAGGSALSADDSILRCIHDRLVRIEEWQTRHIVDAAMAVEPVDGWKSPPHRPVGCLESDAERCNRLSGINTSEK